MEKEPLEVVRTYLKMIEAKAFDQLKLGPNFVHRSPFGVIKDPNEFIEACKLVVAQTQSLDIKRELVEGNKVCVFYDAVSASGRLPMTEWFTVEEGKISAIEVHFDASVRHPGKES